jgi:uncharacterized repeat protein (TIGR04138 family)
MALVDPQHPLHAVLERDCRYSLEAYLFILESLTFAQESLGFGREARGDEIEDLAAPEPEQAKAGVPAETGQRRPRKPGSRGAAKRPRTGERHVSGRELCEAARLYGLQQYGFLAPKVLETWGIRATGDFGELVFNMINAGQMRKTRADRREDFDDVYDFREAFSRDLPFVAHEMV